MAPPPAAPCPGDANGDQLINFDDLNVVLSHWNGSGPEGDVYPPGGDGAVNFDDLNTVLVRWGDPCGR